MNDPSACPCGSGNSFENCCKPVLDNHQLAITAEQLMRSRYTAFVKEHTEHLLRSWIAEHRPRALNFKDNPVTWIGLSIERCVAGNSNDDQGQVEFTSSYIENGQICQLKELSDFKKIDGLWYYVKGDCDVKKSKLERNRPCPCGSGKKFKRCCLNK